MANDLKPIDYTNKDYESFRDMMIKLIPTKTPEWTDFSESDMGIVLIELLAHGLDILSYYQDRRANEAFLPTARQRSSVIKHCAALGYTLRNATPSKVVVRFTFSSPAGPNLVIPKGFQVSTRKTATEEAIIFEVENSVVVPEGATEVDVVCVQGYTVYNEILGSGLENPNQTFVLRRNNVIVDDSLVFWVKENGVWNAWTRVDNFLDSGPTDRHYTLTVNADGFVTITVGSGVNGAVVPQGDNNVAVDYRVGGGRIGNVGRGAISRVVSGSVPGIKSVTNPDPPFIEGKDEESIEEAKIRAPMAYRTRWQAVTLQDYRDLALTVQGVAKANAEAFYDWTSNSVIVYVAPVGGGELTQSLKDEIQAFLDERKLLTVDVQIRGAEYVPVDVRGTIYVDPSASQLQVKERAEKAIRDMLSFSNVEFGEDLYLSQLIRAVMSVEGVRNVVFDSPTTDIEIQNHQLISLNSVILNVG